MNPQLLSRVCGGGCGMWSSPRPGVGLRILEMTLLFGTFFSEGTALGGLGFSDGRSVRELHETVSPPMEMIASELATSARACLLTA